MNQESNNFGEESENSIVDQYTSTHVTATLSSKMSQSSKSASSTPTGDLVKIIESEGRRYKNKGYGLIIAMLFTVSFFYCMPIVAKNVWPEVLAFMERYGLQEWHVAIFGVGIVQTLVFSTI